MYCNIIGKYKIYYNKFLGILTQAFCYRVPPLTNILLCTYDCV